MANEIEVSKSMRTMKEWVNESGVSSSRQLLIQFSRRAHTYYKDDDEDDDNDDISVTFIIISSKWFSFSCGNDFR